MKFYKQDAITELYSDVVRIEHNKETDVFTAFDTDGNEVSLNMSNVNTKATELETADNDEATAKANLKASAKAKLIAGTALTEDEANAIVL
tara:strand:+ start:845 stop:1117 length:273 start_codon:yes stop_codon:yes gene_type:complete